MRMALILLPRAAVAFAGQAEQAFERRKDLATRLVAEKHLATRLVA